MYKGDVLKQGAKINLSLSALSNVIRFDLFKCTSLTTCSALVASKDRHIPYRDSGAVFIYDFSKITQNSPNFLCIHLEVHAKLL